MEGELQRSRRKEAASNSKILGYLGIITRDAVKNSTVFFHT